MVGLHDCGELIACSYTLGIAHPVGYPLYTLFGKGWITVIPIGNIAFRMNMQDNGLMGFTYYLPDDYSLEYT